MICVFLLDQQYVDLDVLSSFEYVEIMSMIFMCFENWIWNCVLRYDSMSFDACCNWDLNLCIWCLLRLEFMLYKLFEEIAYRKVYCFMSTSGVEHDHKSWKKIDILFEHTVQAVNMANYKNRFEVQLSQHQ